jgi:hypothetical protein
VASKWIQRLEVQNQRLVEARREGRTRKVSAKEYCAVGIGRDPRSGLMYGRMCFYQKSNAVRYLKTVNRRDRAQLGHDTHVLEVRIVEREVVRPTKRAR